MLQVDENIGGRQDQKNNSLRTKTLAVGLLMGSCFAAGYFSTTTTIAATTTATTRVATNDDQQYPERRLTAVHGRWRLSNLSLSGI